MIDAMASGSARIISHLFFKLLVRFLIRSHFLLRWIPIVLHTWFVELPFLVRLLQGCHVGLQKSNRVDLHKNGRGEMYAISGLTRFAVHGETYFLEHARKGGYDLSGLCTATNHMRQHNSGFPSIGILPVRSYASRERNKQIIRQVDIFFTFDCCSELMIG